MVSSRRCGAGLLCMVTDLSDSNETEHTHMQKPHEVDLLLTDKQKGTKGA